MVKERVVSGPVFCKVGQKSWEELVYDALDEIGKETDVIHDIETKVVQSKLGNLYGVATIFYEVADSN
ncbi:MAG: hypothetical protein IJN89_02095 [Anaerotignum sp.]|nr:hypothetical protein [Anaerotignum sp.]